MPEQLIVVTGAGASFDCTRYSPQRTEWRPPLVPELFSEREALTQILDLYPDAQSLAADIRATVRAGSSEGLEDFLRDQVLNSALDYDRRRFRSIPLYLQHVLFEVSALYTTQPVNYDRLFNWSLRTTGETVFVTLNYDTLLDGRLTLHSALDSLDAYVDEKRPWSLVKLHGSVNWMRRILSPIEFRGGEGSDLSGPIQRLGEQLELDDEIVLRDVGREVRNTRWDGNEAFYPAISVPLGSEDEFSCRDDHVEFLRARLKAFDGLHVLVIGYSGVDSSLRSIFEESGNSLRTLTVVSDSRLAGDLTAERVLSAFGAGHTDHAVFEGGFGGFADGEEFSQYFARLG